jgi:membrane protein implicated in regulation of membrane protease activity
VLILLAIPLLLLLPSPWNVISVLILLPVWVLELLGWNRTVKHRRQAVGAETMIGREALVTTACRPNGQVRLGGELWEARCEAGADAGETVTVVGRENLTLVVEPRTATAAR